MSKIKIYSDIYTIMIEQYRESKDYTRVQSHHVNYVRDKWNQ